jgi:sugar phosphate isomerase/epimerase
MARINAVSFHENSSIEAICRTVKLAGFDSLEMSRPPFYQRLITRGLRGRFAEWTQSIDLALFGFDCWVDVDPYRNPRGTLAAFQDAIDFACDLDLKLLISHDPWMAVNQGRSAAQCMKVCCELFRQVADAAAQSNLLVVFEPHPDTLSMDNAWACDFIDGLDRPNVGLLYDCCHYGVGQPASYVEAIGVLGQRIKHLHWSDGDAVTYALHLPLREGQLDLKRIESALVEIHYQGSVTNDLFNYPLLEEGARHNAPRTREFEGRMKLTSA